jgi:hypothetical protein
MEPKKISCTVCRSEIDLRGWKAHIRGKTCALIAKANKLVAQGYVRVNNSHKYNWLWTPFVLNEKELPDWLAAHFHVTKYLNNETMFIATPQCAEYIEALHRLKNYRRHLAYHTDLQRMLDDEMFAAQIIIAAEMKQ